MGDFAPPQTLRLFDHPFGARSPGYISGLEVYRIIFQARGKVSGSPSKGHAGTPGNERADRLTGATKLRSHSSETYSSGA